MKLLQPKSLGGFVVRFLIVYALLMIPWPGLEQAYSAVFRMGANVTYGLFGGDVGIRFRPPKEGEGEADAEITLSKRHGNAMATRHIPTQARHLGYRPTAVAVALLLATPNPWRRKWRGLFWGLLAVHVFIGLRVGLLLIEALSQDTAVQAFTLSSFWDAVLSRAIPALVRAPAGSYIVPILIWLLVSFRASDLGLQHTRASREKSKGG
jgi:hypothetical protein